MNMTYEQYRAMRIEFQKRALRSEVWSSCLNCEHWDKVKELCNQFGARPPAEVIVVSCPSHQPEIPF